MVPAPAPSQYLRPSGQVRLSSQAPEELSVKMIQVASSLGFASGGPVGAVAAKVALRGGEGLSGWKQSLRQVKRLKALTSPGVRVREVNMGLWAVWDQRGNLGKNPRPYRILCHSSIPRITATITPQNQGSIK